MCASMHQSWYGIEYLRCATAQWESSLALSTFAVDAETTCRGGRSSHLLPWLRKLSAWSRLWVEACWSSMGVLLWSTQQTAWRMLCDPFPLLNVTSGILHSCHLVFCDNRGVAAPRDGASQSMAQPWFPWPNEWLCSGHASPTCGWLRWMGPTPSSHIQDEGIPGSWIGEKEWSCRWVGRTGKWL